MDSDLQIGETRMLLVARQGNTDFVSGRAALPEGPKDLEVSRKERDDPTNQRDRSIEYDIDADCGRP